MWYSIFLWYSCGFLAHLTLWCLPTTPVPISINCEFCPWQSILSLFLCSVPSWLTPQMSKLHISKWNEKKIFQKKMFYKVQLQCDHGHIQLEDPVRLYTLKMWYSIFLWYSCGFLAHLTLWVRWAKNRRKNCCNMIDDCNVTMVTSISSQYYQKETKQYIYVLYMQLDQMEPNLAESIYIRSSIKFLHFVPFRQQIWPPRAILVSDWLMLKKSSPRTTDDGRRTTDDGRRTDDGRQVMAIPHMTLWVRWAKKNNWSYVKTMSCSGSPENKLPRNDHWKVLCFLCRSEIQDGCHHRS
jgi:hypothetical protein